jgi:hypothetical protein
MAMPTAAPDPINSWRRFILYPRLAPTAGTLVRRLIEWNPTWFHLIEGKVGLDEVAVAVAKPLKAAPAHHTRR